VTPWEEIDLLCSVVLDTNDGLYFRLGMITDEVRDLIEVLPPKHLLRIELEKSLAEASL
jgi:hypothetical protein